MQAAHMLTPPPAAGFPSSLSSSFSDPLLHRARWRWMLAVLVGHVLLLMWLAASAPTLNEPAARTAPHAQQQPRSSVRMVTVMLPPLPHDARRVSRSQAQLQTPVQTQRQVQSLATRRSAHPAPAAMTADAAAPPMAPSARHITASAPGDLGAPSTPAAPTAATLPASAPLSHLAAASASPAASAPLASASGPSGRDLMQGEATRLAIRQATRGTPLLSERADQASQAPERLDATARLGRDIKEAGAGDCLKGEYAGAGMGLLSAPFLLLAKARGRCAK
ncbi:hypothetical protein OU995_24420 [Roseateles sp. SL47]|uniref:hypothetical protein n=1 Tax=Roseateles sp. SL47 TaxID=2995138 RepID=UPI002271D761|nr:hypothetical protein [Roseateles sp. SL47]WAC72645.1 hypothetical protein OU995_24420 [Roseateles sp. SL47]